MANNLGNKETMAKNLNYYMNKYDISRNKLSADLDIAYTTLTDWLKAKTYPRIDKIELMANYFGILKSDLVEEKDNNLHSINDTFIQIPVYGSISCGTGGFNEDLIEDYINIPKALSKQNKRYFGMYADGDSMINENINDGDLIIFEKTSSLNNNDVGCFCIDEDTAVCKIYQQTDNMIYLYPANTNYQPIPITVENTGFHIVGKLAFVINDRQND